MAQISDDVGGNEDVSFGLTWHLIQGIVVQMFSLLQSVFSLLGTFYFLLTILVSTLREAKANDLPERHPRFLREVPPEPSVKKPKCGATAVRLNLDLTRLYGTWYPTEASDSAYTLWMTSLYGKRENNTDLVTRPDCIVLNFERGPEDQTLNIELRHKKKSAVVQGALLADAVHPGTSKWVISWPNGEDTLTSIMATGSLKSEHQYDWLLTVDCDLNGSVSPDWAIFSRAEGLSAEGIEAIKAILSGIEGLRQTKGQKTDTNTCDKQE